MPHHFAFFVHDGLIWSGLVFAFAGCRNNPAISNSSLSRELAKVITARVEEIVKTLRSSKTDDAAAEDLGGVIGAEVAVPSGASSTNKRRRAASAAAADGASPMRSPALSSLSSGSASTAMMGKSRKQDDHILSLLGGIRFTAPYLKENPTHFQNKVKRKVEQLMGTFFPGSINCWTLHLRSRN